MGLFGFGKKKDTAAQGPAQDAGVERENLEAKAADLRAALEDLAGDERVNTLNELGKVLSDLDDVDGAIAAFEESLELKRVMGKASSGLVKLYNKKRAAAASNKDDEGIKYYMDKVNEMLAISKDQLRGK